MKPNKLSESIIYFSCKNIHIHYSTQLGMFKSHIIYYDWKSSICSDIKKRQLLVQLLLCKYKFIDHKHKEEKYFSTSTVLSTTSVQIHWPQSQGGEVLQYKYSTEYYISTNSLTTSTKRRRSTSVQVQYWVLHLFDSYSVFCLIPGPWPASSPHKQSRHPETNNAGPLIRSWLWCFINLLTYLFT